jgi:hypothetical protein
MAENKKPENKESINEWVQYWSAENAHKIAEANMAAWMQFWTSTINMWWGKK